MSRISVRTLAGLLAGFGVAWLGALVLGEYPFTGFLPVIGGALLGVAVVSVAAFFEGDDPPPWAIVVLAGLSAWSLWRAAWIDAGASGDVGGLLPSGGNGPLPWEAWAAVAAAAVGAGLRLVPKPDRPSPGEDDQLTETRRDED